MKNVAILTDFISHEPAYSLCGVVSNQVKMLVKGGYKPGVIGRPGFDPEEAYPGCIGSAIDPGEIGNNVVNITEKSEEEIALIEKQMLFLLSKWDVVLTHDLIYQPNQWKYHVAARRVARQLPNLQWLHWVHSSTDMGTRDQLGKYRGEVMGKFPGSRLVAMHNEEILRKRSIYDYELDEVVVIPNPLDVTEGFDDVSKMVIDHGKLWESDVIAIYPARLDRGKQAHIIIEIFEQLRNMGIDGRIVIIDFHSIEGDKAVYRDEMRNEFTYFTSDLEGCDYQIPHKAVMDLFEYSDVFVHPSRSESDPLTVPEAAWKRCGLVLNFDLPIFRQYDGKALLFKFSSNIDLATGLVGETNTEYGDRREYMRMVAANIAYQMQNNPVLFLHSRIRKHRSLEGCWNRYLMPAIESV